jgi:LmbE family N-acetylglucosaminyl deacetylase
MDDRLNIILSPHFDDAVFSLGGFIAKAPKRVVVVTVFAGTPPEGVAGGWDRWSGFINAAAAMRARCRENEEALAALGVSQTGICNLDYLDDQYRRQQRPDETQAATLRSAIGDDIRELVRRHGGTVNLFSPASAWHPDHQLVTDAVIDLRCEKEFANVDVFLYQDQPYAYLQLRSKSLVPLKFINFNRHIEIAGKRHNLMLEREFLELQKTDISIKLRSAKKYESQYPIIKHLLYKILADFSYYQARDTGLQSHYAELVYRVTPRYPPHS